MYVTNFVVDRFFFIRPLIFQFSLMFELMPNINNNAQFLLYYNRLQINIPLKSITIYVCLLMTHLVRN